MNGAVAFLIGTLLAWAGWIALFRATFLAMKVLFRSDVHLLGRQVRGAVVAGVVAGVGLVGSSSLLPANAGAGWSLPLVWVLMPFTGWVAAASAAMVVVRCGQAVTALNAAERRQRWIAVAAWAVAGAVGWWVYSATGGDTQVFKGHLPLPFGVAVGLIALIAAATAGMVLTARAVRSRGYAKLVATHAALVVGSALFSVPFAWLLSTSFKEDTDVGGKDGIVWIPRVQVTVPYDDPQKPYFETSYKGTSVVASLSERLANGDFKLEVSRPYSMEGIQLFASPRKLKRVPQNALVVSTKFDGQAVEALTAENMPDGRARLRIIKPASLKGTEFMAMPSDTKPVMVTGLKFQNYPDSLEFLPPEANMGLTYLKNTLILVAMSLIGTLLSSALVAYGFSRLRFPGRSWMFGVLLSTMMLPGAVTMLPTFLIFRQLGWIDTLYPLWVPAFFASAFNVFLLRQFFLNIPMELEDAAKIDGCSYLRTFWQVMLPQIKPALAVIAIWAFMGSWNNFMGPLIYISSPEHMPIAYAVQLFNSDRGGEPGLTMAFATMSMVPVLLVFFFAQKYFIEGVQLTGLGGR